MTTTTTSGSRTAGPTWAVPRAGLPPWLLQVGVWLGAAGSVWLWWRNTRILHGLGDWLTAGGRITGLLAGYAVVVLLLLMARVPAVENGVGADRLARWHSFGGRYTVWLATAHTLLIIWGYAVSAHQGLLPQTKTLVLDYPDVLMATVALGLLLLVGTVSLRAARARLRYETWYYLHLYTYLAVALAFSHQFATGAEFVSDRPARIAWSALYAAVAALLVWYRLVTPLVVGFRHRMRVADVRREGPGVVSVLIEGRDLQRLAIAPGQFFRFRFLDRAHWWQSHPYSLSAPPHPRLLRITVKGLGDHSSQLRSLRPGTRVHAEGPYGAFTAARRTRRRVLLLAGGIGVAPLRTLFETLPAQRGDLTLVYRVNQPEEAVLRRELETVAARRGAVLHLVSGFPGSPEDPLRSPAELARLVPDLAEHDVYLCGPAPFITVAEACLRQAGVPARQVHSENFSF